MNQPYPEYGPPGVPRPDSDPRTSFRVLGGLFATYGSILIFWNLLAIPAAVTSIMAVRKATTDPAASRMYSAWTWAILAVSFVIYLVLLVLLVIWFINSTQGSGPYE